jgi:hypothetical protein
MQRAAALVLALLTVASAMGAPSASGDADAFAVAGLTRPEVAAVLAQLQGAVAAHDAARISALTFFPLTVRGRPGPKNASELARDFDAVFTGKVRAAIRDQTVDSLFANWKGVMIGKGEAWLAGLCDGNSVPGECKNHRLLLVSINN